jgi:Raf kinase inhibitor-like YbhB/YbcL family protein
MKRAVIIVILFFVMSARSSGSANEIKTMQLTSPAFKDKESIPEMYTCHGSNVNPELDITNIPPKTKSLALVVDDPDAPEGTWVHWIAYNIPPDTQKIETNSHLGIEGLSDFGAFHYHGPCPANKRVHRYSFRVYALSEKVELLEGFIKSDLERQMKGKILAQAELTGMYKNPDNFNE